jgi:tryptophan synthase alpha chain
MCKLGIYLVCDYPDKDEFLENVKKCEEYGVDFLEIGFPFSDPVADGAVIEEAAFDVLKRENTNNFLETLKDVREIFSNKLYVMTYANIVFGYGIERFAKETEGINGIIIADLPFIESGRFSKYFDRYGTNIVYFATPESSFSDIDKVKSSAKDFVYFVSTRGITGGAFNLDKQTKSKIVYTKNDLSQDVIVGFGIKNSNDIKEACIYADGVVIGTESVKSAVNGTFSQYLKSLR